MIIQKWLIFWRPSSSKLTFMMTLVSSFCIVSNDETTPYTILMSGNIRVFHRIFKFLHLTYKSWLISGMTNDDSFLDAIREEKFDFALHHHMDTCGVGIFHALGVSTMRNIPFYLFFVLSIFISLFFLSFCFS